MCTSFNGGAIILKVGDAEKPKFASGSSEKRFDRHHAV